MSCRCALKTVPILACAMIALDLASAYGQPVSFMAPRVFPTGGSSIVVGDFNGDGKPDLATPGLMLLGNGDGSFRSVTFSIPTGNTPVSIVAGDFNRDGKLDLVAFRPGEFIGPDNGSVDLLLGNGDGTFGQPINIVAGTGLKVDAFVGDVNDDGKPDLIVGSGSTVSIFLGNGDGSFQHVSERIPLLAGPILAVTDINNDGYLDFVSGTVLNTGPLNVFLGKGDGSFRPAASIAGSSVSCSIFSVCDGLVIAGDFNGDGKLDLVVGDETGTSVRLGNGDGTFRSKLAVASGGPSLAGDFNNDGKLDFIAGGSVLLGNGDGTFQLRWSFLPGAPVGAADFNGDGKLDLVYPGIFVLLGKGDGTFSWVPPPKVSVGGDGIFNESITSMAAGDFNGDGKPDLAVTSFAGSSAQLVSVLLGNGDGSFQQPVNYAVGDQPVSVAVADFNADGIPDLAVASYGPFQGGIYVLLGTGNGTFQRGVTFPAGGNPVSVAIGDFNQDGKPDLVVASQGAGAVLLLLGNGDGTFRPPVDLPLPADIGFSFINGSGSSSVAVAVGDFNGDGKLDIATAYTHASSATGTVSVLLGKGNGTFLAPMNSDVGRLPNWIIASDFNGDGKLDLVVADESETSLLLGKGDGSFQPARNIGASRNLVVGDFNGDGKLDLAGCCVSVLLGKGDGTFQTPVNFLGGAFPVVADFNGDGKSELAIVNGSDVSVLINDSPFLSSRVTSVSAASSSSVLAPESIASAYGSGLSSSTATAASQPLPTSLAGTTLHVRDSANVVRPALLYFVSSGQINFQVPAGTAAGLSQVEVVTGTGLHGIGAAEIQDVAPGLFAANANGKGPAAGQFFRVSADGVRTVEPVAQFDQTQNKWVTRPLELGPATDQIYLVLYGTGIRGARSVSVVTLTVGGVTVPVLYAGPQGQYAGLDQVNAGPLPHSFEGRGEINAALTVDGKLANAVTVSFSGRGTFTSIDPPGSTSTIAYGVNTSGQVVGYYTNASGTHGFLMSAGTFSTIDFPGASVTSASGINGAGQIVGTYVANGLHGFLSTGGTLTTLDFPGIQNATPSGINNSGQIVGSYNNGVGFRGFVQNGNSITSFAFGSGLDTFPNVISDSGNVVGTYTDASRNQHGFLRDEAGVFTSIDVPGASFTNATGINNAGKVVGFYGDSKGVHGFLLDGGFSTFDFPGSIQTQPQSISDTGQIVGDYAINGTLHGFTANMTANR